MKNTITLNFRNAEDARQYLAAIKGPLASFESPLVDDNGKHYFPGRAFLDQIETDRTSESNEATAVVTLSYYLALTE